MARRQEIFRSISCSYRRMALAGDRDESENAAQVG
jgi:hypothetical protein